jgi:hypothetical protein
MTQSAVTPALFLSATTRTARSMASACWKSPQPGGSSVRCCWPTTGPMSAIELLNRPTSRTGCRRFGAC